MGTNYYSNKPVTLSGIRYEPKLLTVGNIKHSVQDWEGGIKTVNTSVSLENASGTMSDLRTARKITNRKGVIKFTFFGEPEGNELTQLDGKIQDDSITNTAWTINIGDALEKYDKVIPKNYYNTDDYPNPA